MLSLAQDRERCVLVGHENLDGLIDDFSSGGSDTNQRTSTIGWVGGAADQSPLLELGESVSETARLHHCDMGNVRGRQNGATSASSKRGQHVEFRDRDAELAEIGAEVVDHGLDDGAHLQKERHRVEIEVGSFFPPGGDGVVEDVCDGHGRTVPKK